MIVTVWLYIGFYSFLFLINAAYSFQLILVSVEYFTFLYPNLLQVLFFFQFFKQEFPIHFCLLNTCQDSIAFLPLWSDHPKTICWRKVSCSSSLWNLLQPSVSSCIFVTNLVLSTPFCFTLYLCPTLSIMFQASQSLKF